jgi:hypothetical protein
MTATPTQAREEVYEHFTERWIASTLRNPMPGIRYQGKEKGEVPQDAYVRLSMQQVTSPQSAHTMRDDPGASGASYTTHGLIFVQVFMPASERDAFYKGELLATRARDIFRNTETPSGVWFRNARFNELEPDGAKLRWNVKVEYEYEEINGEGN